MRNWESLQVFFHFLNENVDYLVLRNYEEFLEGRFNSSHPDIDILCRDSKEMIYYAGSESRTNNPNDLIHQQVMINSKVVSLDVRHIGDGYYDGVWEKDMLNNKGVINNLCYVMDENNYFYSLLYHVLVQKNSVSPDYKLRLEMMGERLSVENPVSLQTLERFMRDKHYYFTYPENPAGIANFNNVDKSLIKTDLIRILKRIVYKVQSKTKKVLKIK